MPATKIRSTDPKVIVKDRASAVAYGLTPAVPGQKLRLEYPQNPIKNYYTIKDILNRIHDEDAPAELLTAFRLYWPHMKKMTMKEAWLRVVYMEAIGGQPWASMFIAERSEGKVSEGGLANSKGAILNAVDELMKNPVPTEGESV